jgi:hypothetical protein
LLPAYQILLGHGDFSISYITLEDFFKKRVYYDCPDPELLHIYQYAENNFQETGGMKELLIKKYETEKKFSGTDPMYRYEFGINSKQTGWSTFNIRRGKMSPAGDTLLLDGQCSYLLTSPELTIDHFLCNTAMLELHCIKRDRRRPVISCEFGWVDIDNTRKRSTAFPVKKILMNRDFATVFFHTDRSVEFINSHDVKRIWLEIFGTGAVIKPLMITLWNRKFPDLEQYRSMRFHPHSDRSRKTITIHDLF